MKINEFLRPFNLVILDVKDKILEEISCRLYAEIAVELNKYDEVSFGLKEVLYEKINN